MVGALPPGTSPPKAAASTDYDIPAEECCFTGCCDRGKAFLLEQLDRPPEKDDPQ
ncbi:hypothetical protein [Arthrobacter pityocampae]|uniref:hypothetical protein n=1 Tax=Arthrobacter pityocampae TaxID=547334 RepID=UPI00142E803F|nr:hypothetical protein [Arthrobacter pityocampae]